MTIFLQAAGAAVAEQPKTMGFGELFLAGGWLMWVLLVLGALAIYIFVERFIAIRKASKIDLHQQDTRLHLRRKNGGGGRPLQIDRYPHR
jgi:biopolymer transport protein ExbB/TolQ